MSIDALYSKINAMVRIQGEDLYTDGQLDQFKNGKFWALKLVQGLVQQRGFFDIEDMRNGWENRKEQLVALGNLADAYEAGFKDAIGVTKWKS